MSSLYAPPPEPERRFIQTEVLYAVNRLREKFPQSIPRDELISYTLSQQKRDDTTVQLFIAGLNINPKVNYDKEKDEFIFKPEHNITDADSLLKFLQNQDTAMGIQVSKLKDGWQDAETTINKLEEEHRLLVTRNKKDGHPRMVWLDDPTLQAPLDDEFKELWNLIPLPGVDDTIKELRKMNHKSTGEPAVVDTGVKKPKEKRKVRRGTKITNTHMQGLLRDYSGKGNASVKKEVKVEGR
ncbi:transcription factor TFIIE beta subunit, TFIIEB, Tfa2 [Cladophialophora chaetospira]|uniref:Transcription factor TFIIE beta subunit, TFIIEB, Tfa2 n=1 Tax=Cladophialophora chaetospira TaxID=386627 RepID=A0AA39CHA0_9EURO|nr:transcription factor TFIIE beta subunit, TFIIEB, Tfa2 [Cladophialophora chaetospira]